MYYLLTNYQPLTYPNANFPPQSYNWGQVIIPTAHCSDGPLFRQPIAPTAHFSDNPLLVKNGQK